MVAAGSTVVILEAMKMELIIPAPATGIVRALYCRPGSLVATGDPLLVIQAA
jgi:urea carboxylase